MMNNMDGPNGGLFVYPAKLTLTFATVGSVEHLRYALERTNAPPIATADPITRVRLHALT
jgi:hypothetical protein